MPADKRTITKKNFFLQKLKSCLAYLNSDPQYARASANHYRNIGQYNFRHDKVRYLQDEEFINSTLDPDRFFEAVDDLVIDDLITTDDNKEE